MLTAWVMQHNLPQALQRQGQWFPEIGVD